MEVDFLVKIIAGKLSFDDFDLEIGDLTIMPGLIAVSGANGSGKSSFLRSVLGLADLYSGARECSIPNSKLGYVPQNYRQSLIPWASAKDNLALFESINVGDAIDELLSLGIPKSDLVKRPSELSGGQCQRLSIVREIYLRPKLLVLDEPFSSLDTKSAERVSELIAVTVQRGACVILTSHQSLQPALSALNPKRIVIERSSENKATLELCAP